MTLLLAKRSPDARPSAKARAAKHRDDLEGLSETIPESPPDERSPSDGPAELGEGPLLASKAPDLRFALWDFYAQSCFESQVSLQHIAALLQRLQSFRAWGELRRGARTQARPPYRQVGARWRGGVIPRMSGTGRCLIGPGSAATPRKFEPRIVLGRFASCCHSIKARTAGTLCGHSRATGARATYTQEGTAVTSIIAERPEGRAEAPLHCNGSVGAHRRAANQTGARAS
jgi:hypothetical protein